VESILAGLHCSQHWEDLGGADLVIESVFEDADIKKGVIDNIETSCRASAILATNTSTLTLDVLSANLQRPERLVGMHFFNPAQRMPLLEVVRRDSTPPDVLAGVLAVAKRLRKTPVVAHSREGFIVVRIFVPYVQEAFRLLEEGAEPAAIDQAMVDFGFPMGPLVLIDMTGLDILAETHRVLQRAFPWHGPASPVAEELVRQGHLGQKTGSGVYRYVEGDRRPQANPALEEIVAAARQKHDRSARSVPSEEIAQRLQMRMLGESLCVMAEGVARSAEDVDVATVLGIGFPDFRGGVMTHIEQLGRHNVQAQLRELGRTHGERFAPEVAFQ
jgi:3-hydroxyacyl-CoA dehydrogenase